MTVERIRNGSLGSCEGREKFQRQIARLTLPARSIQSTVMEGSKEPVLPFLVVDRKLRFSYCTGGSDSPRENMMELGPGAIDRPNAHISHTHTNTSKSLDSPLAPHPLPSFPQSEKEEGVSGCCRSAKNFSTICLAASSRAMFRLRSSTRARSNDRPCRFHTS